MAKKTVEEVFSVTVQVDLSYPDDRRVRPRTVICDSIDAAADAMRRALLLPLPAHSVTFMVSRELVEETELDSDPDGAPSENPDLADWPALRHIVTGEFTAEDL